MQKRTTGHHRRVLVIDDNLAIHEDIRSILNQADDPPIDAVETLFLGDLPEPTIDWIRYEVADAYQGEEGIEKTQASVAAATPFDVAFVDLRMPPGLDGLETTKRLWEADPHLQVILCSAYSDYSYRDVSERLGQSDQLLILKKPFDPSEVAQAAATMSAKRRCLEESRRRQASADNKLREQTADLQQCWEESERLLNAIQSLLIGVDAETRVYRWNEAAHATFGIASDQACGRRLLDLPIRWVRPGDMTSLLCGCTESRRVEIPFDGSDGARRILGVTACPTSDGGMVLLARDITDHRRMERALVESQKLEAIGQLARGMAHEMSLPMQYVDDHLAFVSHAFQKLSPWIAQLTESQPGSSEAAPVIAERTEGLQNALTMLHAIPDSVQDARDGVDHVLRIARSLQEFTAPDRQERAAADIHQCLQAAVTVAKHEWRNVADIQWDLCDNPPSLQAFGSELNQALMNLIINAAHAIGMEADRVSDKKGRITIRTRHDQNWINIEIDDSGPGVPEDLRQRIFEPFFTTKPAGKGTGHGLALAKQIIEDRHHGQISVAAGSEGGASFCVRLPIHPETPQGDSSDHLDLVSKEAVHHSQLPGYDPNLPGACSAS